MCMLVEAATSSHFVELADRSCSYGPGTFGEPVDPICLGRATPAASSGGRELAGRALGTQLEVAIV